MRENGCIWLTFVAPPPAPPMGGSNMRHCGCGGAEMCHRPLGILQKDQRCHFHKKECGFFCLKGYLNKSNYNNAICFTTQTLVLKKHLWDCIEKPAWNNTTSRVDGSNAPEGLLEGGINTHDASDVKSRASRQVLRWKRVITSPKTSIIKTHVQFSESKGCKSN